MSPLRTALLALVLAAFAGCGGCDTVPTDAVTKCNAAEVAVGTAKTDILFVVDDSPSMAVEQNNLATNFAAFIQALSSSPVANDFQIAITTTSIDRNSGATPPVLVTTFVTGTGPNAGLPYPAGALLSVNASGLQVTTGPGRILSAASPTLATDFEQNVKVGVLGSGKEQPLRAAKLALTDPLLGGTNTGFLRSGARLAVVFVTDDDDCSDPGNGTGNAIVPNSAEGTNCENFAEATTDFSDFLLGPIAGEQRDTLVGVIASFDPVTLQPAICNVLNPDGSTAGTSEYQGIRLKRFADAFGSNAVRASVCSQTFYDALTSIADQLVPQTFPLQGAPADWRLLVVQRTRGGVTQSCSVQLAGSPEAATADAIYTPVGSGGNPTLTMQRNCQLAAGDGLQIHIVCAG